MDCSICMDEINKQTGLVTLSCEHSFHFRCIDNWFTKQIWDELEQTCPCCRNGGGEMDRCEIQDCEEDDEEEDDDESYEEEEEEDEEDSIQDRILNALTDDFVLERNLRTGQILLTSRDHIALDSLRAMFGPLNQLEVETPDSRWAAALKIQSIFRGHHVRNTRGAAVNLLLLRSRN